VADVSKRFSNLVSSVELPRDHGCLKFFFNANFTATIDTDVLESSHSFDIECFTDGSKISGSSGAGLYINQFDLEKQWCLGSLCTVFQAEVFAILMAADSLLEAEVVGKTIGIFSDSQACIKALMRVSSKSSIVKQCFDTLNTLGKTNEVWVIWVKGHSGCVGNEISDRLARRGAKDLFLGPEPVLPVLNCVWKDDVGKWIMFEHTCRWYMQQAGALTKKFGRVPDVKEARQLLNMTRTALRYTVGILTGHCVLQKHLYILGIVDTPLCPSCGEEEEESVEHYLCSCEAFREVRQQTLGKQYLRSAELTELSSPKLWSYIKATERFQ
jgi:ribonuclease HI